MTEKRDDIIQAQQAPLSHLSDDTRSVRLTDYLDWRSAAVAVAVVLVVIGALWFSPEVDPVAVPSATQPAPTADAPAPASAEQLAPFAQTQRERARKKAQDALAQFVEQQILLEDTMQVDAWGAQALAAAMDQAQTGDAEFLAERFDTSLAAYEAAVQSIGAVIEQGNKLFAEHLRNADQYIKDLNPDAAVAELEQALTIKPNDTDAQTAMRRAERLPEIIGLLRTAKNHELGGRYDEALAVYQQIQQIDPQTSGLSALQAAAASAQAGNDLTAYLSRGFDALSREQFAQAKQAFNQALALDPNNDIAKGGLQQVAKENDLAVIRDLRRQGDAALADERWQAAVDAFTAVLNMDGNIQFAKNGVRAAQTHLRAERLLTRISEAPQKLSSEKLYLDAQAILAEARDLEYAGPKMQALATEVDRLLTLYRDPVDVVLLSDNATDIVMSNVGQLGYFERKTLTLRPGQYTIRGSQDGCRDIFLNVEVLPGIAPLDLSCAEPLPR